MLRVLKLFFCMLLLLPAVSLPAEQGLTVKGVRYFSYPTFTRVVFEAEAAAPYVLTRSADGRMLVFSAYEGPFTFKAQPPPINDGVVKTMEMKEEGGRSFLYIHLDAAAGEAKDFVLRSPDRIVVDISRGLVAAAPAKKTPVVVLDPGHGGTDTGIVSARGVEKALTLDFARTLAAQVKKKDPQITVVLTREKDMALSVNERAARSNSAGATLFLSLHFAPGRDMRVYILEPDDEPAPQAPAGPKDFLDFEAEAEQQAIQWGRQQAAHMRDSSRLGRKLLGQVSGKSGPAPVQAPMAVLKSVDAAAVVVEVGIEADRAKAAEEIVKGIEQYVRENR